MSDAEAHREANDFYFGAPEPTSDERDETGSFQIRTVYLDGVERLDTDLHTSLREALEEADATRATLKGAGYDHRRVHVDVIDLNDGERRLDWDTLEPE